MAAFLTRSIKLKSDPNAKQLYRRHQGEAHHLNDKVRKLTGSPEAPQDKNTTKQL